MLLLELAAPLLEDTVPTTDQLEEARARAQEAMEILAEMIDLLAEAQ